MFVCIMYIVTPTHPHKLELVHDAFNFTVIVKFYNAQYFLNMPNLSYV